MNGRVYGKKDLLHPVLLLLVAAIVGSPNYPISIFEFGTGTLSIFSFYFLGLGLALTGAPP